MQFQARVRNYGAVLILSVVSIGLCLIVAEGIMRLFVDPLNFLRPYLTQDDILGASVQPHSAGHDAWGFRNKTVPDSADIVVIGDSQTYGYAASANNSWPAKLQTLLNKDIYNISLGAFSPPQYYYLLKSKAVKLHPDIIIAGFYFGNDLLGTYNMVYTKEYWKYLRNLSFTTEHKTDFQAEHILRVRQGKFLGHMRTWLSHHSVLYRSFILSFGNIFRLFEMRYGHHDKTITTFKDTTYHIHTGFTPKRRLDALNLKDPTIQEGLCLSLHLLRHMHELCLNLNIDFFILLIPTKENVYSEYIENNQSLQNSDMINTLLLNERKANSLVKAYLTSHHIPYYDVLEPLQQAAKHQTIYPQSPNGHPTKEGYAVIATALKQYLLTQQLLQ